MNASVVKYATHQVKNGEENTFWTDLKRKEKRLFSNGFLTPKRNFDGKAKNSEDMERRQKACRRVERLESRSK